MGVVYCIVMGNLYFRFNTILIHEIVSIHISILPITTYRLVYTYTVVTSTSVLGSLTTKITKHEILKQKFKQKEAMDMDAMLKESKKPFNGNF